MEERILAASVNFRMLMKENETYEEARQRFINNILVPTIHSEDDIDWDLEYCEEE